MKYDYKAVEAKWQKVWEDEKTFHAEIDHKKPKFYALVEFPYPSGAGLHVGHPRSYTALDVVSRKRRQNGYNVLYPMGWDAFGLPTENFAMKNHIHPAIVTKSNVDHFRSQLKALGFSFDWDREINTTDPEYYKWTQWIFLQLYKHGLAYKKEMNVNWCTGCKCVLANEEVVNGVCERCGSEVVRKEKSQWMLAITKYAQRLIDDLDDVDYIERVKTQQRNWIGRSTGAEITFKTNVGDDITVYTTRADTLFGTTYMVISPEHPLLKQWQPHIANWDAVAAYQEEAAHKSDFERGELNKEKTGVRLEGIEVMNPVTHKALPMFVSDYVLMGYGEGAVMAVPAHDERDFAFAKKFGLPIKQVVAVDGETFSTDAWQEWYGDKTRETHLVNSGEFDGLSMHDAIDAIAAKLASKGLGQKEVKFRLRDWGISRQRYWGTPIPMINCPHCGPVPVPEKDLPVELPEDLVPDGSGNPLTKCDAWKNVKCPKCGADAERETDTMDTFVDSSWYFQRYCSPDCTTAMVDKRADYWMPMDQYIGGIEHAVLHLLYARFWTKVMRDFGLVKYDEPFKNLFTQGMLMAECYYRDMPDGHRRWYYPDEVEVQFDDKARPVGAISKEDGEPVVLGGIEKMSKSKNNVVEPRDIIKKFGADTARSFVMFAGPPDQSAAWSNSGAEGTYRFLRRIWNWAFAKKNLIASAGALEGQMLPHDAKTLRREVHTTLRQAEYDFSRMQYNTVVSACMKMFNTIEGFKGETPADLAALCECASILLRTLYPIAPHITTALWQELGFVERIGDLIDAPWPEVSEDAIKADELKLVVQVNGKLRGEILVPAEAAQAEIEAAALANPDVQRFTEGMTVRKIIIVKNKLVNVVVAK